jgi:AraC-like DNA-binding protein
MFPGNTARALMGVFGRLGVEPRVLERAVGRLDARLPDAAFSRLWRAAAAETRSEALELDVAEALQNGALGPFDLSALSAPTVGAACTIVARHLVHLLGDGVVLHTSVVAGGAVRLDVLNASPVDIEVSDALLLATLVSRLRMHSAVPLEVETVQLTRSRPAHRARWDTFFETPVRFAARQSALVVSARAWRAPLVSASPAVQRALAPLLPADDARWLDSVRAVVRHRLTAQPDVAEVGRALGVSGRTLQRRLRERGVTLRDLVAQLRVDEARRLLEGATLGEVASRVGFSSAAALSKAMRRR